MRPWSASEGRPGERRAVLAWARLVALGAAVAMSGCVYRAEPARVRSSASAYAASTPPATLALEPAALADAYGAYGSDMFEEFARADDALGSVPGPLLATGEWPELPRVDPTFQRFVSLPSSAQTLVFFRSTPSSFGSVQDRRNAVRRPFGPFFSPR